MNLWGLVSVTGLVATGSLAVYMSLLGPRTVTSRPFILMLASFALWDLGEAVLRLSPPGDLAPLLPWVRVEWIGISLNSGTFLHFAVNLSSGRPLREHPWRIPAVYAVSAVVVPLVVFTDTIVGGVALSLLGPTADVGSLYVPAAIWYEAWFLFTLVWLLQAYARNRLPEFRRRTRFVMLILGAAVLLGSATEVFWPFYTPFPADLGLGSMYTLAIAAVAAVSEFRFHFLEIEAVTETAPAARLYAVRPGLSHLFLSRQRDPAFVAFREIVATTPGLCISGVHPAKLQRRYGLERTPILWVTTVPGGELSVRPKGLEFELFLSVARFVKGNPSTVVLVDDVDLLVHTNGFDAVARFLHRLNNLATGRGSTVLAAVDPDATTPAQLAFLRGLFDEVRELPPSAASGGPPIRETGAVLMEGDPEAALDAYESASSGGRGMLVTTKNPARLRGRLGSEAAILWVAGSGEASEADGGPVAIDLEAGKLAADLLRGREHPVLFAADLEQLRLFAPFPRVLEFVKMLIDQVALRDGLLLASVAPEAFEPRELASLRRRFDRVRSL